MGIINNALIRARKAADIELAKIEREMGSPVDVGEVAQNVGLTIETKKLLNNSVSGFLKYLPNNKGEIVVNENQTKARQRFTIAHEIGHYILHKSENIYVDDNSTARAVLFRDDESSKATKLKEIEANQFAAELSMPIGEIADLVRSAIADGKDPEDCIDELARKYDVSVPAMTIRFGKVLG